MEKKQKTSNNNEMDRHHSSKRASLVPQPSEQIKIIFCCLSAL